MRRYERFAGMQEDRLEREFYPATTGKTRTHDPTAAPDLNVLVGDHDLVTMEAQVALDEDRIFINESYVQYHIAMTVENS